MDNQLCQECLCPYNATSRRRVNEGCGHEKCRQCLLAADSGCAQCPTVEYADNGDGGDEEEGHSAQTHTRLEGMPTEIPHPDDIYWEQGSSGSGNPSQLPLDDPEQNTDHLKKLVPETVIEDRPSSSSNEVLYEEVIDDDDSEPQIHQEIFNDEVDVSGGPVHQDYPYEYAGRTVKNRSSKRTTNRVQRSEVMAIEQNQKRPSKAIYNEDNLPVHLRMQISDDGVKYECTLCEKILSRSNFVYHIYCDPSIVKPFPCPQCPKQFRTADHLRYHGTTHAPATASVNCTHCQKTFRNKNTLAAHVRQTHSGLEAPYTCNECGKTFFSAAKHKQHANIHTSDHQLEFECDQCPRKFRLKENWAKHVTLTHTETKAFQCTLCGTGFKRNGALKKHMMRTHPGSENDGAMLTVACKVCGQGFTHSTLLRRHERLHQDVVVEYRCKLCPINCARRDNLLRHLRVMHFDGDGSKMQNPMDHIEVSERHRRPAEYELDMADLIDMREGEEDEEDEDDVIEENVDSGGDNNQVLVDDDNVVVVDDEAQEEVDHQQQDQNPEARKSSVIIYVGAPKPKASTSTSTATETSALNVPRISRPVPVKRSRPSGQLRPAVDDFSNMSSDKMEIYRKILMPSTDLYAVDEEQVEVEGEDGRRINKRKRM